MSAELGLPETPEVYTLPTADELSDLRFRTELLYDTAVACDGQPFNDLCTSYDPKIKAARFWKKVGSSLDRLTILPNEEFGWQVVVASINRQNPFAVEASRLTTAYFLDGETPSVVLHEEGVIDPTGHFEPTMVRQSDTITTPPITSKGYSYLDTAYDTILGIAQDDEMAVAHNPQKRARACLGWLATLKQRRGRR